MARQPNASGVPFVEETLMAQETQTLAQAQAQLEELIHAAQNGSLVPIRLPGQLEAILNLVEQAQAEQKELQNKAAVASVDDEEFLKAQAFFVSHAVHELRTPMTSIRGYADMLRSMGALNDMQKQFVETIRINSKRMEGLLTDVSDTAKLKANVLRTNIKMDMFKNIAMMVEKQAQPVTEELGAKLTFEIPQGLPILNVDGELLAKALYKLVENGLRYSSGRGKFAEGGETPEADDPQGEVSVRATGEGNKLILKVQDNGIGMSAEELNQLGTIYFRADNELVRSYKGSGLGIPVSYGIIRMLGGTITVESQPNQGTTFTITLTGMS
ncbi:MAG TPA: HAMP domain-containing sensor histidine kinase [Phototrophicaceae bacterium]|nr:HAMP domain-containing sensor histidine kinase [Phototrophicaceae bacterium]